MTCPACGTTNAEGRRFCMECGTDLSVSCASCGARNEPEAKFCGQCGTRVGAPGAPAGDGSGPATSAAERRVVTILFADLVGSTTLADGRDPELVRDLLDGYFARCREILGRYGGWIEKFIGDAVMAVWGAPIAHEDDATRAVLAALELVDAIPALGAAAGVELRLRAGVLTGEAAVNMAATDQAMVAGDLPNTAARLQSVAAPGTVLVGTSTRAAVEGISFEPAGEHVVKGKAAPIDAWRAIGPQRDGAADELVEPPFVGRADELRLLKEQFHAVGREGRVRLVSIVGVGGIGKSRLAEELERYLSGIAELVWWHRGRSPSYGDGVAFWALGEMVRRRAGLAEGADDPTTRRAIDAMLEAYVPDVEERAWIAPRLLALLGVGEPPAGGREELFAAWRTLFERLSERGTVALVFEDLHAADDGQLDFLEHLLDWARNHPIFVLTLARPELLERRPGWGTDRRGATALRLDPLPPDAMRALLEGIAPGLPDAAVTTILQRADGVPLYVVETVRMLLVDGRLVRRGDRIEMARDLGALQVPATLQALAASRLDALPASDRKLLQHASVLGLSFTLDALAAITGDSKAALDGQLAGLVRRELLTIERDPRSPTRGQHAWVQALLQEVAYATLPRRERRSRHLAAARYYEALGDDELAPVLASHYLSAYQAAPEGPEGEAVAAQARRALVAGADRAEGLGALPQAIASLRSALEVTTDAGEHAQLLVRIGVLETYAGRYDSAVTDIETAMEAYRSAGDDEHLLASAAQLIAVNAAAGRLSRAESIAASFRPRFEALEAAGRGLEAQAQFAEIVGRISFRIARFADAVAWADRALRTAGSLNLDRVIVHALMSKAIGLKSLNRSREAQALHLGAYTIARELGEPAAELRALVNLASVYAGYDPLESLRWTREGIRRSAHLGMRTFDTFLAANATVALRAGEWDWYRDVLTGMLEVDREPEEREFLEALRKAATAFTDDPPAVERSQADAAAAEGDFQSTYNFLTYLLERHWARGDMDGAVALAEEMVALDPTDYYDHVFMAWTAFVTGRRDLAGTAIERLEREDPGAAKTLGVLARAIGAATDGRIVEAAALFSRAVDELGTQGLQFDVAVAHLAMAELLPADHPLAGPAAEAALSVFEALGAAPLVRRVRAARPSPVATVPR